MPQRIDLREVFGREPRAAVEYFESKGYRFSWNWFDTLADAHARAFTVARVVRLDVLQDIRAAVAASLKGGGTERDFIKRLRPELQRKGWWGKKVIVDSAGGAEVIQEGSVRRLRTIYRTNLQTSYMAGRWQRQWANREARPYLQYIAVLDERTRPEHRALNGRVYRIDDPIWRVIYPPNGWGCRCRVRALSARQVQQLGLKVFDSTNELTPIRQVAGIDARTGEQIEVDGVMWQGIDPATKKRVTMTPDPGWSYNPGLTKHLPDLDGYDEDLARQFVADLVKGPVFKRWYEVLEKRVYDFIARPDLQTLGDAAIKQAVRAEMGLGDRFPVAILRPELARALGVSTQTVYFSDYDAVKQAVSRQGQNFFSDAYQFAQEVLGDPELIVRDAERNQMTMWVRRGDTVLVAVLQQTRNGRELYLKSFRRGAAKDFAAARKRGKVIYEK